MPKISLLPAYNTTGASFTNDLLAIVQAADGQTQRITPAQFRQNYIPRALETAANLDTTLRQVIDGAAVPNAAQLYLATNKSAFAGSLSVGHTGAPGAVIDVIGVGATDATVGLKVRASSGGENMVVKDGGQVTFRNGVLIDPFGSFSIQAPSGSIQVGNTFSNGYSAASAAQTYMALKDYNSGQEIGRIGDDGSQRQAVFSDNANFTGLGGAVILGANSTSKGFLPPRMTTAQFQGIGSRPVGLMAFSNDDNGLLWYDGANTVGFRFNNGTSKYQGYNSTAGVWADLN
jgi:hypothetical protein